MHRFFNTISDSIQLTRLMKSMSLILLLLGCSALQAQTQFPWPVTPFNNSQYITGTFAEYRSTSVNGHFHNGTDIPKADGSAVYPVKNGNVTALSSVGSNAYVRVNDIAYVHILPNPSLSVGSPVIASQTVLGTILPGLGHVHFTNGYSGAEKVSLLSNSGLTPYEDTWAPIIRYTHFYQDNTLNFFSNNNVNGLVDIIVKVDEQSGPSWTSTSIRNNGIYKIGYKILSADTSTIVYEPSNNGVRFQFDTKPSNSYVNIAYFRPQSTTTSHVYQVTNNISSNNSWNTTTLPLGPYVVMTFAEDTRGNADTMYTAVNVTETDLTPPAQPTMRFVAEASNGMLVDWYANTDNDLEGYRLYFSFDNEQWDLFRDENYLTANVSDTLISGILNRDVYFRLTAVDNSPLANESPASDSYGMSNGNFLHKVLIVDGFDRTTGSWTDDWHDFAVTHGQAIIAHDISFDTAPNEAILDSSVSLADYDAVFWILGDEEAADETFSSEEQALVRAYLESGGYLFLSGSKVAWDLDPASSSNASVEDGQFLNDYLKAAFADSSAGTVSVSGVDGSILQGLNFNFGQIPYFVQDADVITSFGGAETILQYDGGATAAIQYGGTFGAGSTPGKLIYFAFPFETIASESARFSVMEGVLDFFFDIVAIDPDGELIDGLPRQFAFQPNYPNPFNPSTTLEFHLPKAAEASLVIYNSLGQRVRSLVSNNLPAGIHTITWDGRSDNGSSLPSGIYLARFQAKTGEGGQTFQQTRKLLMVK